MPLLLQDRFSTFGPSHRVRLAAIAALTAVAGCLAIVAYALVTDLMGLLVALACVFVVAFSGWFVLTRRGVMRLLVVPGGLLGIAGLIGFLGAHGLTLLALIGVLALSGAAARYAVTPHRPMVHPVNGARRTAAAQQGVLIINPKSGGGKAERFNLSEEARRRGIEPLLLEPGIDLHDLAERAVKGGADVIGMAGGDGSQAVVATVAMRHDVAHVCVPAGTLNHFALDLGLDRDDVVGSLDAFTDGVERRIDLARVNERVFVNNASLGVYARVVQADCYRDRKLGTWKRMLPEMLGPDAASVDLQFEGPTETEWPNAALVVVSNNPYQLRRLGGAGTRPRLDSGLLGILTTRVRGPRDVAKLVTLGVIGQSQRFRGLLEWSRPEFEVRSGASVPVGLDGEALLLAPPLRFASLPGALRVRVPRHAPGVSPAAATVGLTRRDLGRLIRIAAGRSAVRP